MHWASIVTDRVRFARRRQWDQRYHHALDQALEDRTRLASALYRLVTVIQAEYPHVSIVVLQAEAEALAVLQSVGGIDTNPTAAAMAM